MTVEVVRTIPESVAVIRDIFQAPIYVLHAKSSSTPPKPTEWKQPMPRLDKDRVPIVDSKGRVIYQEATRKYSFLPGMLDEKQTSRLPTIKKARILDAMLMLFASQDPEKIKEGYHPFRFCDINIAVGRHPKAKSSDIVETIEDYTFARLTWKNSWEPLVVDGVSHDANTTIESFSIIKKSSLFSEQSTKHIGRSKDTSKWHWVKYDEEVINKILNDKSQIRYFFADIIKALSPGAWALYRYFFGFGDDSGVFLPIEQVKSAVSYQSNRMRDFIKFLKKALDELLELGLIFEPRWGTKNKALSVRCKSQKSIKEFQLKSVLVKNFNEFDLKLFLLFYKKNKKRKFEEIRKVTGFKGSTIEFRARIVEAIENFQKFNLINDHSWLKNSEGMILSFKELNKNMIKLIDPDFEYKIRVIDETILDSLTRDITPKPENHDKCSEGNKEKDLSFEAALKLYKVAKANGGVAPLTITAIDAMINSDKRDNENILKAIKEHILTIDHNLVVAGNEGAQASSQRSGAVSDKMEPVSTKSKADLLTTEKTHEPHHTVII